MGKNTSVPAKKVPGLIIFAPMAAKSDGTLIERACHHARQQGVIIEKLIGDDKTIALFDDDDESSRKIVSVLREDLPQVMFYGDSKDFSQGEKFNRAAALQRMEHHEDAASSLVVIGSSAVCAAMTKVYGQAKGFPHFDLEDLPLGGVYVLNTREKVASISYPDHGQATDCVLQETDSSKVLA